MTEKNALIIRHIYISTIITKSMHRLYIQQSLETVERLLYVFDI